MNPETREFILSMLSPGKIKIYLMVVICVFIYAIYYRINRSNHPEEASTIHESFANKDLKSEIRKYNDPMGDTDSIIEQDVRSSEVNSIKNSKGFPKNDLIDILEKKMLAKEPFEDIKTMQNRTNDDLYYKEQIATTQKALAAAENTKLEKYNTAIRKYLDIQSKSKLNVNLIEVGKKLEDGILNVIEELADIKTESDTLGSTSHTDSIDEETRTKKRDTTSDNIIDYIMARILDIVDDIYTGKWNNITGRLGKIVNILIKPKNLIPGGILMMGVAFTFFFIDITD